MQLLCSEINSFLFISSNQQLAFTAREETALCLCWEASSGISLCVEIPNSQAWGSNSDTNPGFMEATA